ncbi:nucleoside triphosphate pyrophosphohydrolase family protein [Lentzea flaviverrucosa]|uniref:MazG nucleotide pyrophosphohydrolase domain-containing protein n=1 Tax=Lentzea flaviverrucosa TaxID=200379 RepID=A0A1H9XYR3_9PSEU|nr:nucleoside triphosphate pyrophosphohydrolase family protein [Lentzea flaviverrucosa]RDI16345.1 MazG-like nucleotide pyrophosphohydrolase family protein [Lentzea flaviverrucosa]SES51239.1 MazG nucleotide pyrophosphohydrolase domain-containing protein [Lentzea flaviverrucosa]
MKLDEFQRKALQTDQRTMYPAGDIFVPLLGLVGEVGSLATEYKKQARDGVAHTWAKARLREELGDVLWYVAVVADRAGLSLDDIAVANLDKVADRWMPEEALMPLDLEFPDNERFPGTLTYVFRSEERADGVRVSRVTCEGTQVGDPLTDSSANPDYYRFHDIFHLSYAAALGWSPVTRALLKRKRKSQPAVDENEDGGRAIVIEEGIAALVFAYAATHSYLDGIKRIDTELLGVIKKMTNTLEVGVRSAATWEQAILRGFAVWNQLRAADGGVVHADLRSRSLTWSPLTD